MQKNIDYYQPEIVLKSLISNYVTVISLTYHAGLYLECDDPTQNHKEQIAMAHGSPLLADFLLSHLEPLKNYCLHLRNSCPKVWCELQISSKTPITSLLEIKVNLNIPKHLCSPFRTCI